MITKFFEVLGNLKTDLLRNKTLDNIRTNSIWDTLSKFECIMYH